MRRALVICALLATGAATSEELNGALVHAPAAAWRVTRGSIEPL
ncbi:MAG: hypothetical protein JWM53_1834, partial [bacterium]|nr:hypothetical protein [bacterium]